MRPCATATTKGDRAEEASPCKDCQPARLPLFPVDDVSRLLGLSSSLARDSPSPCGSRTRRSNVTRAAAATRDSAVPAAAAADTSIYGDIDNHADLTAPLLGTMTDPAVNGDRLTSPGKIILGYDRSSAGRPIAFRRSTGSLSTVGGFPLNTLESFSDTGYLTRSRGFIVLSRFYRFTWLRALLCPPAAARLRCVK